MAQTAQEAHLAPLLEITLLSQQAKLGLSLLASAYGKPRVILADNLDALDAPPDECVNAIITDPPYGLADNKGSGRTRRVCGEIKQFDIEWDQTVPVSWLPDAFRVLIPGGALTLFAKDCDIGNLWMTIKSAGFRPRHTFIWNKPNPGVNPRHNFVMSFEMGIYAVKPRAPFTWNGGGFTRNVIDAVPAHNEKKGLRFHPTEKPRKVVRWLLRLLTNPDDIVLDPFAGSATTGVEAILNDRRFIGVDNNPEYVEIANRRLSHWLENRTELSLRVHGPTSMRRVFDTA